MNFINILEKISDNKILEAKGSRRETLGKFKNAGKGIALASIPFALAASSNKTKAATFNMAAASMQASPTDVLNFALTLEYLERDFYQMGMDTNGLIPAEDRDVFGLILRHEVSHVDFLLSALGDAAITKPSFDFSGGDLNLPTFSDYGTFMALSQGFEDTGVRAYKGQAGALVDNDALLEYALQIHSVEARHASQVRRMRGEKGWITGENGGLPSTFDAIYAGEANTVHLGVDFAQVSTTNQFGLDALTEAYDEPLTMAEVNAIASIFIE